MYKNIVLLILSLFLLCSCTERKLKTKECINHAMLVEKTKVEEMIQVKGHLVTKNLLYSADFFCRDCGYHYHDIIITNEEYNILIEGKTYRRNHTICYYEWE